MLLKVQALKCILWEKIVLHLEEPDALQRAIKNDIREYQIAITYLDNGPSSSISKKYAV